MTLGERVNHMRVVNGWSVPTLAAKAGMRVAKLESVEAGTQEATIREKHGLARALAVTVAYLDTGEGATGLQARPAFVALVLLLAQLPERKADELLIIFAQAVRQGLHKDRT